MNLMSKMWTVMAVSVMVGGCAPTTISPNWGTSYRDALSKQVLNPSAGEQLDPVEGQDGVVNATAMDAYRKGFEKPDAEFNKSVVSSGVKTN